MGRATSIVSSISPVGVRSGWVFSVIYLVALPIQNVLIKHRVGRSFQYFPAGRHVPGRGGLLHPPALEKELDPSGRIRLWAGSWVNKGSSRRAQLQFRQDRVGNKTAPQRPGHRVSGQREVWLAVTEAGWVGCGWLRVWPSQVLVLFPIKGLGQGSCGFSVARGEGLSHPRPGEYGKNWAFPPDLQTQQGQADCICQSWPQALDQRENWEPLLCLRCRKGARTQPRTFFSGRKEFPYQGNSEAIVRRTWMWKVTGSVPGTV